MATTCVILQWKAKHGWALLHAMKETIDYGFKRVQFESDSKVLVDASHSRRRDNLKFSLIVTTLFSPCHLLV
jgi:hypothetical protein